MFLRQLCKFTSGQAIRFLPPDSGIGTLVNVAISEYIRYFNALKQGALPQPQATKEQVAQVAAIGPSQPFGGPQWGGGGGLTRVVLRLGSIRGCYPYYDTCLTPGTKGAGVIRGIVGFGFGGTAAITVLARQYDARSIRPE